MAFFTEIGKKYNVTGVMGGWDNYTPAIPDDEHARGESTGTAVLQLKGKQIEVTSHEHRVEEGYPANQGEPYAPYEVVKVKEVGGDETEYYAWVVYNGDINVEEIVEQEDPPDSPDPVTDPDPPIDPPKPDEDIITNGTEVHVRAGETMVLDVTTNGKGEDKTTGDLEIEISDLEGNPVPQTIYLSGAGGVFEMLVKEDGKGSLSEIPAGNYLITTKRPEKSLEMVKMRHEVYFENESHQITSKGDEVIEEVISFLRAPENNQIKKILLKGFANELGSKHYRDNLKLKRIISVKNLLIEKAKNSISRVLEKTTELGEYPVNKETEDSGKVEFWGEMNINADIPCHINIKDFVTKDIHTVLGESAAKNGAIEIPEDAAPVRSILPNTYWHYFAYLPTSQLDENGHLNYLKEESINVYEFRIEGQSTYDSNGDDKFEESTLLIVIEGQLALLTITQVTENNNDTRHGDSGRRIHGYYQIIDNNCQLSQERVTLETPQNDGSMRPGHYVFRRGIDIIIENDPTPIDTHSQIEVVVAQRIRDKDLADEMSDLDEEARDNDLIEETQLILLKEKMLANYKANQVAPDWYPKIEELLFINQADDTDSIYQEAIQNIENIKNRIQSGGEFVLGCPENSGENRALIWFKPEFEVTNIPTTERGLIITDTNQDQTTGFRTDFAFKFDFKRSAWGQVWIKNNSGDWIRIESLGREIGSDDDIGPYGEVYDMDEYLPDLFFSIPQNGQSIIPNIKNQISSDSPAIYLDANSQIPALKDNDNNVIHDFTDNTDVIKLGSFVEWVEVQFVKRTIPGNNIPMYEPVDGHQKVRCSSVKGSDNIFWHTVNWLQKKAGKWERKSAFDSGVPRDQDNKPTNKIETGFIKIPETLVELQQFLSEWRF